MPDIHPPESARTAASRSPLDDGCDVLAQLRAQITGLQQEMKESAAEPDVGDRLARRRSLQDLRECLKDGAELLQRTRAARSPSPLPSCLRDGASACTSPHRAHVEVDHSLPRLVNLCEDGVMDGPLVSYLHVGRNTVGSCGSCDVCLDSPQVCPMHLVLVVEAAAEDGSQSVTAMLHHSEAADSAVTSINGDVLCSPVQLQHGDRVIVGSAVLRFAAGFRPGSCVPESSARKTETTIDLFYAVDELKRRHACVSPLRPREQESGGQPSPPPSPPRNTQQGLSQANLLTYHSLMDPDDEEERREFELKSAIYNQKMLQMEAELARMLQSRVTEELWESEQKLPLLGWGRSLKRRPRLTTPTGAQTSFSEASEIESGWTWLEPEWRVVAAAGEEEGWWYAGDFSQAFHPAPGGWRDSVRKRRWVRTKVRKAVVHNGVDAGAHDDTCDAPAGAAVVGERVRREA